MGKTVINVERGVAIAMISGALAIPKASLECLSAVELDRVLCCEDVAAQAMRIIHDFPD